MRSPDHSLFHREPPRDQLKVIDGEVATDDIYTVEKLLNHRGPPSDRFFLIKWKGFPSSENTWEPEKNLLTCQGLLKKYWEDKQNATTDNPPVSRSSSSVESRVEALAAPACSPETANTATNPPPPSSDAVNETQRRSARSGRLIRTPSKHNN